MKKTILLVLFVLTTALTIYAQDKDQFTIDTEKLIELNTKPALQPMIDQFSAMVAADKKEAFLKEVNASFPEFYASMAKIYMKEFTHEDIKKLLDFYNSEIGKKMSAKQGAMQQQLMMAGQTWGMKIQGILGKYQ